MQNNIISFLEDEQGGTAAEYAILASLIAVAIIFAVTALGISTDNLFNEAKEEFSRFNP